jgi:hypothetical protein
MFRAIKRFFSKKVKAPNFNFVISEAHDDYHLQVPGSELGNLTIYYCTPTGCIDLATSNIISEYTVEVVIRDRVEFKQTYNLGQPGFGRFRIYANGTENHVLGGYRPKCTNPAFVIRVTSPDANGYKQCGRMKLIIDGTLKQASCGDC